MKDAICTLFSRYGTVTAVDIVYSFLAWAIWQFGSIEKAITAVTAWPHDARRNRDDGRIQGYAKVSRVSIAGLFDKFDRLKYLQILEFRCALGSHNLSVIIWKGALALVKVMVDSRENAQRAKELWNDSSVHSFSSQLSLTMLSALTMLEHITLCMRACIESPGGRTAG